MKWNAIAVGALVADVAATVAAWPHLPARVAVHWNFAGEPDRFGSPLELALVGPVAIAVVWLIVLALPRVDPRLRASLHAPEATPVERTGALWSVLAAVVGLLAVVHGVALAVATGLLRDAARGHALALAAFLIACGNVFGRLRPSWFVGIRTPWTLSSDEVWRRTHRLAGRLMVAAGLLAVPAALALPAHAAFGVVLTLLMASTLGPAAWSFFLWRAAKPG